MDNILINKLKNILQKNSKILFAYIFGSSIEYKKTKDSDIDLAIYITSEGLDTFEYLNLKRELMDVSSKEIDIVILNNGNPLIKHEVFRDGIELFSKDSEFQNNFIVHSLFEYEDMKKYYDLSYKTMIDHIRKEVKAHGKN